MAAASSSAPMLVRVGAGKHCALAQRIPAHKKTGNYKIDSDNADRRDAFKCLVDELMIDDAHAPHLLAELHRRKSSSAEESLMNADTFKKNTMLAHLDEVSDMTTDIVVKAKEHDNEAVQQLLVFGLQLPGSLRLNEHTAIKSVTKRVFQEREVAVGKRLQTFAKNGGVAKNGALNWAKGCYSLEWSPDGKRVVAIKHMSGASAVVPDHAVITPQHKLHMNWSDALAYVERPPMPQIRLFDFFKEKGDGPVVYKNYTTQAKDFVTLCKTHREKWADEQRSNQLGSQETVVEATTKLAELSKKKKKTQALEKARAKAKASNEMSKKRRMVSLEK